MNLSTAGATTRGNALTGFNFNFGGTNSVDLRTLALAAGWNGTDEVFATMTSNVGSNSTGTPGLTVSGSFPNGVTLTVNSGIYLVGAGGAGGDNLSNGNPGGTALSVTTALKLRNNGVIGGGGGGGGDDGGGGAGLLPGAGFGAPVSGSAGTLTTGGSGGSGPPPPVPNGTRAGSYGDAFNNSGSGGGLGTNGQSGDAANGGSTHTDSSIGDPDATYQLSNYPGGGAGSCTAGNSNITWLATGTRYGALN